MSDDVYLLDSGDDVFLWVGKLATKREKRMAMDVGLTYLEKLPGGGKDRGSYVKVEHGGRKRGEGVGFYCIDEGNEPLYFTGFFFFSFFLNHFISSFLSLLPTKNHPFSFFSHTSPPPSPTLQQVYSTPGPT